MSLLQMDSKLQGPIGPIGPPGVNGSQGPIGPTGPQGAQGGGNFSQCVHKTKTNTGSQSKVTSNSRAPAIEVILEEPSVSILNAVKLMMPEQNGSQLGTTLPYCTCQSKDHLVSCNILKTNGAK